MNTVNIQQNNDLKEAVFKKIECGEVSMRPKSYFYFKIALSILVIFSILMISSMLISYILYTVRIGGHLSLLGFGKRGIYEFFMIFPWIILIIDIALLFFLDWLLKSFRFGYNSPIIYLFLATFMSITIIGSLINYTSFHSGMMFRAEKSELPVVGSLYGGIRRSHSNYGLFRGVVESITGNTIILYHEDYDRDADNNLIQITVPEGLINSGFIKVGDQVFVAGDATTSSSINAYGITKLEVLY